MKTWGTEDFFNLKADALLMQGDEIVSSADAKLIIEFFDGTIMRVDGKTDVIFSEIDDSSNPPAINVALLSGKVWFNKLYRNTGSTTIKVKTTNLEVDSQQGSIYEVENEENEVVRVFNGNTSDVEANIYSKDGAKVVETEKIGVGQEIVFSDAALEKYWAFQSPSVLAAASDEFKLTPWYVWNAAEDKTPTVFEKSVNGNQFVKVNPEQVVPVTTTGTTVGADGSATMEPTVTPVAPETVTPVGVDMKPTDASTSATDATKPADAATPAKVTATLPKPTIVSVGGVATVDKDGFYVVKTNPVTLTGGVAGTVYGVSVNGYNLKKYKSGDTTWNYFANADYGLMKEGENTYEVYAVAANGDKGPSITVKVKYQPEKAAAPVNTGATNTVNASAPATAQ
jgi:hypothetical protein